MAYPPGVAGRSGPLLSTRRALTPSRCSAMRIGVTRLGFCPVDTINATATAAGQLYPSFRDDPEPGVYAPPDPTVTYTPVVR